MAADMLVGTSRKGICMGIVLAQHALLPVVAVQGPTSDDNCRQPAPPSEVSMACLYLATDGRPGNSIVWRLVTGKPDDDHLVLMQS